MTNQINYQRIIPSTDVIQLTLTLKMTTAQVVETSVTVNNNSPMQDFVTRTIKLKLLLNLQSCVARRPLCHKVNLPRCEARRRRFIMICDIFGTGQMNMLGLCYLFKKTYKQPTVAPLKSLKSTHSIKLLHLLRGTIRYH